MRIILIGVFVAVIALQVAAFSQTIDFETLPDGSPVTDGMLITDQYSDTPYGVTSEMIGGDGRPNIIYILLDDWRWDMYKHPTLETPTINELVEEGVSFRNSFVTTPICAASRASIFTGLYERTHEHNFELTPIVDEYVHNSYPVKLRKSGYYTGFIGKYGVLWNFEPRDLFDEWYPEDMTPDYKKDTDGDRIRDTHLTEVMTKQATEFIEQNSNKTFSLSISYWAPHTAPATQQFFWPSTVNDTLYADSIIPNPRLSSSEFFMTMPDFFQRNNIMRERWYSRFNDWEDDECETETLYDCAESKYQSMIKGYYRMITGVDNSIKEILDELKNQGIENNTVIIIEGDNGFFLGERRFAGKWLPHEESLRVPFIVYDPRNTDMKGIVRDEIVLNVDVAPTLLDLAGIPIPPSYQGRSVVPLFYGNQISDWRTDFFTEHLIPCEGDFNSLIIYEGVRSEDWMYAKYPDYRSDGSFPRRQQWDVDNEDYYEELYDISNCDKNDNSYVVNLEDDCEEVNLAYNDDYSSILNQYRQRTDELKYQYLPQKVDNRYREALISYSWIPDEDDMDTWHLEGWAFRTDSKDYLGSTSRSDNPGAKASFKFKGSSIKVVVRKVPYGGKANVYIDDHLVAENLDTYSPTQIFQSEIYEERLPWGEHKVAIEVTGKKDPNSLGEYILFDYFEIGSRRPFKVSQALSPPENPQGYALMQNRPNPFDMTSLVRFDLPELCVVRLLVYDVSGRLMRVLTDERWPAGRHSVTWMGDDEWGNTVGPGVYFLRMEAGDYTDTKKMVLVE
ncbi:MAG: sulfatase-like hydrolase/transferase [Candidatus Eisenbacteria bacterium]